MPVNPAGSMRRPRHVVTSGQPPVLDPLEVCALLDSVDTSTVAGLRDRALIGLIAYLFARIGAALGITVEGQRPTCGSGLQWRRYSDFLVHAVSRISSNRNWYTDRSLQYGSAPPRRISDIVRGAARPVSPTHSAGQQWGD
jgi:hypothetical protein